MANVPVGPQRDSEQRFLQLLIKEIEKGYNRESTLKAESWEYICRQMNIEFAAALLALNGVQWNMTTNKVKAETRVWFAYYRAHQDAPCYRRRGEKHFDLMCHLFESGVCFD